jgi:hypothetical protein
MTKHLKAQELSAYQDGVLTGMARARAEAHLATCAECRATLERAVGLEHTLAEQLQREPDEKYFHDFASRIEARVHPAGAHKLAAKAPPGDSFWTWLNTPVGMSWAGAVVVLVVGAGVALITVRSIAPGSYGLKAVARTDQVVVAPPPAQTPGAAGATAALDSAAAEPKAQAGAGGALADQPATPPANEAEGASGPLAQQQPSDQRAESAPARVMEMKPGPNGESVPVERRVVPAPAPPPNAPADLGSGAPIKVRKNVTAQPLAAGTASKDKQSATTKSVTTKSATSPKREAAPRAALQAVTSQRCGAVRDASGRPVVGAQLMLVETGSSAQSRADGSFCLDLNAAARTLVVMAVGFEAQRVTLDPADQGPLTLTLRAVSVVGGAASGGVTGLENPTTSSRWVQKPGAATGSTSPSTGGASSSLNATKPMPTPVGSTEAFASLSDSVRVVVLKALQFENDAARAQSAEQYKLTAEEWQRVLKRTQDGPAEGETRFRIAAAYYHAWQLDPTHARSVIALEAISSFVLRAPSGPERDQATMWLGHLKWGDTKAADH